jgi:hypothetical protein
VTRAAASPIASGSPSSRPADLDHVRRVLVVHDEARAHRLGAVDEEANRAEPIERARRRQPPRTGKCQRRDRDDMFAGDPQQRPAGHQHPRPKVRMQGGCGRLVGRLEADGPRDRRHDEIGIAQRGQRDERHRVEPGVELRRHLDRKPGLAHPARPGQGHQPCHTAKQATQRDRFPLAPHDRGQRHRPLTDPLRST